MLLLSAGTKVTQKSRPREEVSPLWYPHSTVPILATEQKVPLNKHCHPQQMWLCEPTGRALSPQCGSHSFPALLSKKRRKPLLFILYILYHNNIKHASIKTEITGTLFRPYFYFHIHKNTLCLLNFQGNQKNVPEIRQYHVLFPKNT